MVEREVFLSAAEAAAYLGVSENTVRRWCKKTILPHRLYPGGILKISAIELKAFIESHKKTPSGLPQVPATKYATAQNKK